MKWLIIVRPHAFADHKPTVSSQSRAGLTQAKQEVLENASH